NVYRALANGGTAAPARFVADAVARGEPKANPGTHDGPKANPGIDNTPAAHRVFGPAASYIVADILADRAARALTFGLENPLATRVWSAVKTGTSKDMRDNWCIGFTARYTVGVWVGNFSGAPMRDVSGVTGAAPIWREI